MTPRLIGNTNEDDSKILEGCSEGGWNANEGATGENAKIVIDMGCPIKLQNIQLINGAKEFGTKDFSIFSSPKSTGPWSKFFSGSIEKNDNEVSFIEFNNISTFSFIVKKLY